MSTEVTAMAERFRGEAAAALAWEADFDGWPLIHWIQANWKLPLICCAAYLVMIFLGPVVMKKFKPMKSKAILALWNLLLSTFSWVGVSRCVPHLASVFMEKGFKYTICTHPQEWYMKGGVALWMGLFCLSKLPELIDTLFLVLRKKPVIFLHWYHHVSGARPTPLLPAFSLSTKVSPPYFRCVRTCDNRHWRCTPQALHLLLYCWHAYHFTIPAGIWFACMNYTVHGIMYFYYFLMAVGLYRVASSFAGFVTALQITQMLIGTAVMGYSGMYFLTEGEGECYNNRDNVFLGFAMYLSYFMLFAAFAVRRYLLPSKKAVTVKKTQ